VTINVQPIANPSSPSVRFTAFELPMIANTVIASPTITAVIPAIGRGYLLNGTMTSVIRLSFAVSGESHKKIPMKSASASWTHNLTCDFAPRPLCRVTFM